MSLPLLIRDVTVGAADHVDVAIDGGVIAAIGRGLPLCDRIVHGRGGVLLPGLHDHHLHLFGLAAQMGSLRLDAQTTSAQLRDKLTAACTSRGDGDWIRVTGYHESAAGSLDRDMLDRWAPRVPVRVQYATGTLWVFNSAGLTQLRPGSPGADPLERDPQGRLTGRLWHGDAWLRQRTAGIVPDFAAVGKMLAAAGVTGVTDTSPTTGAREAALLSRAHADGRLPQRLHLMSEGPLEPSANGHYTVGPVKVMLHEAQLPDLGDLVARIAQARSWGRTLAFHCATATELAFALAALDVRGVRRGDRIEHGSVIDASAIPELAARGLTVVTQPAFIEERGDRYLATVDPDDVDNLYRCGRLLQAGVRVAGSTDAPYGAADPWAAMRSACTRRTRAGRRIGEQEAVSAAQALAMFMGSADDPGGAARQVVPGVNADLCLLTSALEPALRQLRADCVAATIIGGELAYLPDADQASFAVTPHA